MSKGEKPLRLAWIGFHVEGVPTLQVLVTSGTPLEGVITLGLAGRLKRSGVADYASLLRGTGIPLHEVEDINSPLAISILDAMQPDIVFVIGWSQILRGAALATARVGMVGAHASLLPHNRGSAPVNWAIIRGETFTGNTLIWLSESVDDGEIIDQTAIPITPYDTCETIYEKIAVSNRDMILRLLPRLRAGERPGQKQPHTSEPLLPRRKPADGLIDWRWGSRRVYDFIRALTRPYPGAFSWLNGKQWRIWNAAWLTLPRCPLGTPGVVLGPTLSPLRECCGQVVVCGEGAVVLLELEDDEGRILKGEALSEQPWTNAVWGPSA